CLEKRSSSCRTSVLQGLQKLPIRPGGLGTSQAPSLAPVSLLRAGAGRLQAQQLIEGEGSAAAGEQEEEDRSPGQMVRPGVGIHERRNAGEHPEEWQTLQPGGDCGQPRAPSRRGGPPPSPGASRESWHAAPALPGMDHAVFPWVTPTPCVRPRPQPCSYAGAG